MLSLLAALAEGPVSYVDDHFVPHAGAMPVTESWNTTRRGARP
ncbi:hypothetical protein [Arthrobacter dokdonensis]|nr:hypothetical protein [Arthrobacter dokdonellae]